MSVSLPVSMVVMVPISENLSKSASYTSPCCPAASIYARMG